MTNVYETTFRDFSRNKGWYELTSITGCAFILFYMPNCPWCLAVKPTWEKLSDQHAYVTIAKFDITNKANREMVDNLRDDGNSSNFSLPSFPTMVLFIKGKAYATYKGDRSIEDFGRFLMKNTVKGQLCIKA